MKCSECGSVKDVKVHGDMKILLCNGCRARFPLQPCIKCGSIVGCTRHSTRFLVCGKCRIDLNFMIGEWTRRRTRNVCVHCDMDLPEKHGLRRYMDGYLCAVCVDIVKPTRIGIYRWG